MPGPTVRQSQLPAMPDARAMGRALSGVIRRANATDVVVGRFWYDVERAWVQRTAADAGIPERTVAGVAAALSPRVHWTRAKAATVAMLAGHRPSGVLGGSVRKASRIIAGERPAAVLRGPKVRAFYANLRGYAHAVTVDVWAARAAGVERELTPKRYRDVAAAYRRAAARADLKPCQLQAAIWVTVRGRAA